MEDIIFLIIAVAISIFAAINKSRKAQMADQLPDEQQKEEAVKRRNRFMDQLLGEDFMEEKKETEAPPKRVQPAPRPVRVATKISQNIQTGLNYQLPKFKSTLPDRPKHKTVSVTPRYKEEEAIMVEGDETSSYLEEFSLRKAVVYSIILEQKY